MFEVEKGFLWDPWHVEGHLRGAGFVDIQIRQIHVKVGDWVEGNIITANSETLILSRQEIEVRRESSNQCLEWSCWTAC